MKNLVPSHTTSADSQFSRSDDGSDAASPRVNRGLQSLASPRFSYRLERTHDEDELVRRCSLIGAQRSEAVTQLLDRLEPAAYLICNLLIEDRLEAAATSEDACVEAVTCLFDQAPADASEFRVTFFRILREHCQKRDTMSSPANNPVHREFRALIADMPERQRWVSVLRFIANLSRAEIADVLDDSIAAVKTDLWTALQQIMGADIAKNAK